MSSKDPVQDQDLRLVGVWIIGVLLVVILLLVLRNLKFVLEDCVRWIIQVFVPVVYLVLSRVFGINIAQSFAGRLSRSAVSRLALIVSAAYVLLVLIILFMTADVKQAGLQDMPNVVLEQLRILNGNGAILVSVLWPVLSIILDYLFNTSSRAPAQPDAITTPKS